MKKSGASQGQSAPELISQRIAELFDWCEETKSRMRKLIRGQPSYRRLAPLRSSVAPPLTKAPRIV